jgi:hypothetical protein
MKTQEDQDNATVDTYVTVLDDPTTDDATVEEATTSINIATDSGVDQLADAVVPKKRPSRSMEPEEEKSAERKYLFARIRQVRISKLCRPGRLR